jgi:DNA modification methylase
MPTLPMSDVHPATFPQDIPHRLILLYSTPDATVLDPFGGSMTTGVAAWELGRKAILCELSERFCEIGAARIDRLISQGRLFKPEPTAETQREMFGAE